MRPIACLVPILLAAAAGCHGGQPPSILVVVVDTLRADRLGCYGYSRPTSPRIDALAASGTLFERAQATSAWTVPSLASLLTGELPSRHGAGRVLRRDGRIVVRGGSKVFHRVDESVATVAARLREEGYATAAILNNPFLAPEMGLDRGFDHYELLTGPQRGRRVTRRARAWLAEADEGPFFLLVHYMDPHTPYWPPRRARGRFTGDAALPGPIVADDVWGRVEELTAAQRQLVSDAYDEEILGVDREIGRLLGALRERHADALVVLTSDHGEELFDHGGFEHGHSLHREVLQVPLIVAGPGVARQRVPAPVSLVDVAPTLLRAAGVRPPPSAGASLWPLLRGDGRPATPRPQVAEGTLYGRQQRALVRWPHKLIVEGSGPDATRRLYDLEADPTETENLAGERRALADALVLVLEDSVAQAAESRVADVEVTLYDLPVEELDALGYLEVR